MVSSRIISLYYCSVQNCQNLCSKCAPHTRTQVVMTTTPLADSGVNDRLVKLRTALIDQTCFEFIDVSYFGVCFQCRIFKHKIIKHKVIKSRGALRRINNANVSNLIQIITALCNNLDHMRLTR